MPTHTTTASGPAAFGTLAKRLVESLAPSDPVVVFDVTGAAEAVRECAARKFRGESFLVRALLPREWSIRADAVAGTILSAYATSDERRLAFEQAFAGVLQVNNQLLRDIPAYAAPQVRLMQAAVRLADGVLVSSEAERRRIQDLLQTDPAARTFQASDPSVPRFAQTRTGQQDAVVIWAPHLAGDAASSFAVALAELRFPLVVVSESPLRDEGLATWYSPDQAAHALERAKLIIDTSSHGCDAIRPLATWNVPIVADVESGAQEAFDGIRVFNRLQFTSIFDAVVAQLGAPAPTARQSATTRIESVRPAFLTDGPRVSVILPTLDRRDMIQEAIQSMERQTYRNVEPVIVIDGGPSLADLEPLYPRVRFIHMPENNPVVSTNTAFAAATGAYIAILNDDDLFFPDHIAALVSALERSGADVAHADVMTAFLRGSEGDWTMYGVESNMSRATSAGAFLVSNQIGATSGMFRRTCIEGDEAFDASIPYYRDYELWLRLSLKFDFIHVERITSCYTIRNQGAKQQSVMWSDQTVRAYEALYERYPTPDRPLIQQRREQILVAARSGQMDLASAPAAEITPVKWPLWSA